MPIGTMPVRARSGWPVSCASRSKQLARVHDAVRIERLLDRPHCTQRHRRGIALQFLALEAADAVLGADAAGKLRRQVVYGAPDARFLRQKRFRLVALNAADIEMQIAVARVSVAHQYAIVHVGLHPERSLIDKLRQRGHGYADIVLEARARVALRLRHTLAQPPERGAHALAGRERRIE